MNRNDWTDLTIKHTLELDFLFWQTATKDQKKKNKKKERVIGKQGVNPKQSDAVRPIPEEEKQLHKLKHVKKWHKGMF